MIDIKMALKMTVLSASLFALVGCGGECCLSDSKLKDNSIENKTQTETLKENGTPLALTPNALEPKSADSVLPPVAVISVDGDDSELIKIEPHTEYTFSGSKSNDPDGDNHTLKYKWTDLNDDDLGTGVSIEKEFPKKGLYRTTLLVTDEQNLTDSVDVCLLVGLDKMPLYISAGENQTITEGDDANVTAKVLCQDGLGFDYEWLDNGESISTEKHLDLSDLGTGVHKLKLVIKDFDDNCVRDTVIVTVVEK